ncbi:MAG: hypothetical protein ABSG25_02350 [Bryobacteraceae bacterium]
MLGTFSAVQEILKATQNIDLIPQYKFFVDLGSVAKTLATKSLQYSSVYTEDVEADQANTNMQSFAYQYNINNLLLTIKGVNTPEMQVNANEELKYPKINTAKNLSISGDLEITFYPDSSNLIRQLYYNWLALMVNFTYGISAPKFYYEVDIPIYIYDRIGNIVEQRTYHNCSPREITEPKYDSTAMELQSDITIKFNVNNNLTFEII